MSLSQDVLDEYKIWKKNTPFLYDYMLTMATEWPSLTVQWLPDISRCDDARYNNHRLILGTHAVDEQNYLMLGSLVLPDMNIPIDSSMTSNDCNQYGGFGSVTGKMDINVRMCHNGEVNMARYMPQNPCVIATKSPNPDVCIYDYTRHPSVPDPSVGCIPDLVLSGHIREGYGLSWSNLREGHILSAADDGFICYWDINQGQASQKKLSPLSFFVQHQCGVEDVAWHNFHQDIFASVAEDGRCMIWDIRSDNQNVQSVFQAHQADAYCIAMSPFSANIFATGSSDKSICIWDIRNLSGTPVHKMEGHKGDVIQLQWSPHKETLLSSCSSDRRVHIWDLARIGVEMSYEDIVDGPPELLFVHGGHTSKVCDISWNFNEPLMMASVADDNIIQFWKMIYIPESPDMEPVKRMVEESYSTSDAPPMKLPKV